ncbi:MAG: hypothetical protein ACK5UM_18035 [Pseudomonadota bacterium]|jgi:hypothetical protein|nr:hypothetical protein [Burkholderiaceae bacterium]MCZ8174932.1 hypothetical protein [Burkholderiaceae bacterium]
MRALASAAATAGLAASALAAPPAPADPRLWATLDGHCVQHPVPRSQPAFPLPARQAGLRGRVLVMLHFDAPDRPPALELVHRPSAYILREAIQTWAADLRRPCHAGERLSVRLVFAYQFEGESAGFGRFGATDLLALARGGPGQRQAFDTTGMRCPIAVRWQYLRPYRPNEVTVLGPPDPAHAPVVARLQALELALTRPAADVAWGDVASFEIPCHPSPSAPKE